VKKVIIVGFIVIVGLILINIFYPANNSNNKGRGDDLVSIMNISSPSFSQNENIPVKFTCDGEGINPRLEIFNIPEGAKSLVLIMDDPDAPAGTFTHWLLWNINSTLTAIEENGVPDGSVQGLNDTGKVGYIGPCPPNGSHRYFFKLYALDSTLDLQEGASKGDLESAISDHKIDQAEFIGLYERS